MQTTTLYQIVCRRGGRCAAREAKQIHCVECQYVGFVPTNRKASWEDHTPIEETKDEQEQVNSESKEVKETEEIKKTEEVKSIDD